jgi:hypothetical protein
MNVPRFDARKKNNIFSPPNTQIVPGTHLASYSGSTLVYFSEEKGGGGNMTTHLHLVPSLRMIGSIPLFPICLHALERENFACFPM